MIYKCIKKTRNETVFLATDESNENKAKLSEYIEGELVNKERR